MINWLSNLIAKRFWNKFNAERNADPIAFTKKIFKNRAEFLNKMHNGLKELYFIGSYPHLQSVVDYFKKFEILTLETFDNFPFERNTTDEDIIEMIIGRTNSDEWFLAFFSENIDLYSSTKFIESVPIKIDDALYAKVKGFSPLL